MMTIEQFHQLWDAERHRMQERGRAFCIELRRQEALIRDLLPAIRNAFRVQHGTASGANDNMRTKH